MPKRASRHQSSRPEPEAAGEAGADAARADVASLLQAKKKAKPLSQPSPLLYVLPLGARVALLRSPILLDCETNLPEKPFQVNKNRDFAVFNWKLQIPPPWTPHATGKTALPPLQKSVGGSPHGFHVGAKKMLI